MNVWFCLASGPSQCPEDCAEIIRFRDQMRGYVKVAAINNTVKDAQTADVLFSSDPSWWAHYTDLHRNFQGRKVALAGELLPAEVQQVEWGRGYGLARIGVNCGNNSGYALLNWLFHEGADLIVLTGYDMSHDSETGEHHYHEDHPAPLGNFSKGMPELCAGKFPALAYGLSRAGITVLNSSRKTALKCFERMPLSDAFALIVRLSRCL